MPFCLSDSEPQLDAEAKGPPGSIPGGPGCEEEEKEGEVGVNRVCDS